MRSWPTVGRHTTQGVSPWGSVVTACRVCTTSHRGGVISGSLNFVWELSRFKLAAKFPNQNPKLHRAHKARHITTFLGVSARFATQNPGVTAKFLTAKFTLGEIDWVCCAHPPPYSQAAHYIVDKMHEQRRRERRDRRLALALQQQEVQLMLEEEAEEATEREALHAQTAEWEAELEGKAAPFDWEARLAELLTHPNRDKPLRCTSVEGEDMRVACSRCTVPYREGAGPLLLDCHHDFCAACVADCADATRVVCEACGTETPVPEVRPVPCALCTGLRVPRDLCPVRCAVRLFPPLPIPCSLCQARTNQFSTFCGKSASSTPLFLCRIRWSSCKVILHYNKFSRRFQSEFCTICVFLAPFLLANSDDCE